MRTRILRLPAAASTNCFREARSNPMALFSHVRSGYANSCCCNADVFAALLLHSHSKVLRRAILLWPTAHCSSSGGHASAWSQTILWRAVLQYILRLPRAPRNTALNSEVISTAISQSFDFQPWLCLSPNAPVASTLGSGLKPKRCYFATTKSPPSASTRTRSLITSRCLLGTALMQ